MSEAQPTKSDADFLDESPAPEVAALEDASVAELPEVSAAPEIEPPPVDEQESALSDPEGDAAVLEEERELTLQEQAERAKERSQEIREQLIEVRRIQEALNQELHELEKFCLQAEAPPSLHEQNLYAQRLDQPEYDRRSEHAGLLAQLAQRIAKKPHPPIFLVKSAK